MAHTTHADVNVSVFYRNVNCQCFILATGLSNSIELDCLSLVGNTV